MSWVPSAADRVAAEQVRYWLAADLKPCDMIVAITGQYDKNATPDDAHHAIAEAWSHSGNGARYLRMERLAREAA
ncbi:MAG: hypothetical protein ACR2RE_21115 [Geminicoccaceae bacterium]